MIIQDRILPGMDVYVDYTLDYEDVTGSPEVVVFDYGIQLDSDTVINSPDGRKVITTQHNISLRGYKNTEWMYDMLLTEIAHEEGIVL